jgi:Ca2+-binding EF-hand superfamily protein
MKSITVMLAAMALSSTLVLAQDDEKKGEDHPKRSPEKIMKKLDTNSDGKISLEEWKASPRHQKDPAKAEELFKTMDTNKDGFISMDELKAHPWGAKDHAEKKADADKKTDGDKKPQ